MKVVASQHIPICKYIKNSRYKMIVSHSSRVCQIKLIWWALRQQHKIYHGWTRALLAQQAVNHWDVHIRVWLRTTTLQNKAEILEVLKYVDVRLNMAELPFIVPKLVDSLHYCVPHAPLNDASELSSLSIKLSSLSIKNIGNSYFFLFLPLAAWSKSKKSRIRGFGSKTNFHMIVQKTAIIANTTIKLTTE